jgi:triosephosphate isomerase
MHSKKHFIANWKMNGLIKDLNHISRVSDYLKKIKKNDFNCTFCLPYTLLGLAKSRFDLKKINLGAQNFSVQDINSGPYTGSISINMLKDLKCKYVIIGHSELRAKGETNLIIKTKIKYALEKNLKIILCVGENLMQYKANKSFQIVKNQLKLVLPKNKKDLRNITIAYEPIWSIGTGIIPQNKYLNNFFNKISNYLKKDFKFSISLLYGGSVSSKNIKQFVNINKCNGFLIGGASLKSKNFIDIIKNIITKSRGKYYNYSARYSCDFTNRFCVNAEV